MARIKLQKVFKNAFPLEESKIVTQYYHLTRRKNSRKYFDEFDKIWEQKWLAISALKLDKVDRLNMLDIGAGPGIFAWMCVSLGHLVDITELPFDTEIIENDNLHYFEDLKTSYELDKTVNTYRWEITKETDEFPIEKQYDLITIQRSNFDIGWEEKNYLKFINPRIKNR
jgi:2-polyprenyl-3-methyl-5-hydroxy-6-metoxy-1,4-benzoquinol methylase